ncbi:unnamed protein product, partial [Didymodactylos carnosus]
MSTVPHFSSSTLNTTYCVRPSSSLPSFSPPYISPVTPIPTVFSRYNAPEKIAAPPALSIHLMFKVRPNYKRLFLDDILPNATRTDYEEILDDDDFNEEIKFNNDYFTESTSYRSPNIEKESKRKNSNYFEQRNENAAIALQQTTVSDGNIMFRT